MTNDISSNYVDITYTVDEIHAMSKLLYKVQKDSQYSELLKDEDLIEFVDKTTGNDFLRHISRTEILLHILDIASYEKAETVYENYTKILLELKESGYPILKKPMFVILNKCDASDIIEETMTFFKNKSIKTHLVSALSKEGIETLKQNISDFLGST